MIRESDKHIIESEMDFGKSDENTFYIEESDIYKRNLNSKGVRMVEFLKIIHKDNDENIMMIIEAKTAFPKEFESTLDAVAEKLRAALLLTLSLYHKRHKNNFEDLPERFRQEDVFSMAYFFILVIKNHQDDWLEPIRVCLKNKINVIHKIWRFEDVLVLNEQMARDRKLIF